MSSNRVVWKFEVPPDTRPLIKMPAGARPLTVQMQGEMAMVWMLVKPDNKPVNRQFVVLATGESVAEDIETCSYVGTFQTTSKLVFHLFDAGDKP